LKIGILGTRGIPANYGGFETFAEECGAGLAARGHDVVVYGRSHYIPRGLRRHRDVSLVVLPTLRWKYTDTVVHTFISILHALFQRFDAILICNAANSVFAWMPRVVGVPVAVNVDGIERRRRKWNWLGKSFYWLSEHFSVWFPDIVITDAKIIQEYYRNQYRINSEFIPYGAITDRPQGRVTLDRLGLTPGGFFLYVSRLEPENNAHLVIQAFEQVKTDKRLVIVGDAPYAANYVRDLRRTRDNRILFPGAIYGDGYRELLAGAFCYIHATEVGGTHPALIEAMGQGNVVVANGTPENREVMGNSGICYRTNDSDDLRCILQAIEDDPAKFQSLRQLARVRVAAEYSWADVVSRYEQLFVGLARKRSQTSDLRHQSKSNRPGA
jgi:glycosyltransferase involved in cell wall biosynthesis